MPSCSPTPTSTTAACSRSLVREGYAGTDPRDRRHGRARDASCSSTRASSTRSREARGPLGARHPDARRGRRPGRGRGVPGRHRPDRAEHVETSVEPEPPSHLAARRDPEVALRSQPPAIEIDLDRRSTPSRTPSGRCEHLPPDRVRRGARGRAGRVGDAPRRRPHPRARRSSGCGSRGRATGSGVIVFSGDLGRPGTPIIRDPTYLDGRGLRARRVDVRRPRARAAGGGRPPPRRDRPPRQRCGAACCSSRRSRSGGPRRSCGSSTA